jgi:hypothetical protein
MVTSSNCGQSCAARRYSFRPTSAPIIPQAGSDDGASSTTDGSDLGTGLPARSPRGNPACAGRRIDTQSMWPEAIAQSSTRVAVGSVAGRRTPMRTRRSTSPGVWGIGRVRRPGADRSSTRSWPRAISGGARKPVGRSPTARPVACSTGVGQRVKYLMIFCSTIPVL